MTAHRTATAAAVAVATPLLLMTWAAGPAQAHGAPTDPVSRVVACSPEGGSNTGTAACKAAIAANGAPFTAWDNLRVAGVAGRDRQLIPDGQLCSGGLPAYKGLNLARADWPSTRMTPGATFTLSYSSTIPHTGTFKLYLSKPGYDPTKPLKWSDLPTKPFATATDPALVNGAYRIKATLPSDRTGRQMLYTIWQNTSTTDTYYSCSDVVFPSASGGGGAAAPTTSSPARATATATRKAPQSPRTTTAPADRSPSPAPESSAATTVVTAPDHLTPAADTSSGSSNTLPLVAGAGGAAALLLTAGVAITLRRRR
ncbi:lytic polysaccharide monooxygenase [Streptomyces sp. NBC_00365]|uniref:lytic polysaccharide monooxygenase auxiliary activity family 9 protein n=1 Tax=Streptomyces sp. NBC_00365 TaxID=2975726 RepID=UPI00224D594B|nr:lytic polysaccharide monooxygenase [Streptomyces sp. NBC_00365]MCX5093606.1 lytic polysaccharide monooxygenase [Streptomyces sp. NBC_00365]